MRRIRGMIFVWVSGIYRALAQMATLAADSRALSVTLGGTVARPEGVAR